MGILRTSNRSRSNIPKYLERGGAAAAGGGGAQGWRSRRRRTGRSDRWGEGRTCPAPSTGTGRSRRSGTETRMTHLFHGLLFTTVVCTCWLLIPPYWFIIIPKDPKLPALQAEDVVGAVPLPGGAGGRGGGGPSSSCGGGGGGSGGMDTGEGFLPLPPLLLSEREEVEWTVPTSENVGRK